MKLNRVAYPIIALLLAGCVAGSKVSGIEGDSVARDERSVQSPSALPNADTSEEEIIFSPVPRKFDGLEELYSGPIQVRVRMAHAADLQDFGRITQTEAMTLFMGSAILVGGAFGAAALPLLGAYAAFGTIFFGGVAPGMSAFEQHRQANIAEAIAKVDFPQITQAALERRLSETYAVTAEQTARVLEPERTVEVVVLSYGFAWNSRATETACSFLQAQIRLMIPGRETQKDWVYIEPSRRSDDAPPPYCSFAKKLFADDSALACQTLTESAEILAAIVAKRLESGG
jgi:hypothetical protein